VVWDPRFRSYDFGPDHPFSESSRELAVRLLERSLTGDERSAIEWIRSVEPAERRDLERFHEAAYVERVQRVGAGVETVLLDQGDTPGRPGCFEAAARLVGGAVRAGEQVWHGRRPGFHPAGGLHHAGPGRASGFCIFNDLAVAIAGHLSAGRRIAYLDIDAHHGDGVMYGFYRSGRLLDIDFHQDGRTLFPGTGFPSETGGGDGAGSKVNLPLPPGAGDEALLPLYRRIVPPLIEQFRPEMIVLQHGVDGHAGDPLAQLQYSADAYAEIDRRTLALADEFCDGRLLVTGGGGYRPESVARVLARAGRIVAGLAAPEAGTPVPDAWRTEFFEETGSLAPEG
jgi:acetoin utilization protein AcuC